MANASFSTLQFHRQTMCISPSTTCYRQRQFCSIYVIQHEKIGLMYTKYTRSYETEYLHYCITFLQSASCIRFCRNDCISGYKFVKIPCFHKKIFNFVIQKCGQILCAHKTHFLMPGHILVVLTALLEKINLH